MAIKKKYALLIIIFICSAAMSFCSELTEINLPACIKAALDFSDDIKISEADLSSAKISIKLTELSYSWQASLKSNATTDLKNSFSYANYIYNTGDKNKITETESKNKNLSGELNISRKVFDYMNLTLSSKNTYGYSDNESLKGGDMQETLLDSENRTRYETAKNFFENSAQLKIPLIGYEKTKKNFENAENYYKLEKANITFQTSKKNIIKDVTAKFNELLKKKMNYEIQEKKINFYSDMIELLRIQFEQGEISILELQQEEIELENLKLTKTKLIEDIKLDCGKITHLTSLNIQPSTKISGDYKMRDITTSKENALLLLIKNNASIKNLESDKNKAVNDLAEITEKYKPELSLLFGLNLDGRHKTPEESFKNFKSGYSAQVSYEYPFWNRKKIENEKSLKMNELYKINFQINKNTTELKVKIEQSYITLNKIKSEYESILKKNELTETNLAISEIKFQKGAIKRPEVIKMELQLLSQFEGKLETIGRYNAEILELENLF